MADTNKITYVSLENLGYYDEKLKAWVTTKDNALQANIDGANGAIEAEITRAKAAEATNALAAENAQKAADAAQGDVDALEILVGILPEGTTASNVVEYVNVKTAGIATDAALEELQNQLNGVQGEVATIKGDYLKNADKTELADLIQGNTTDIDAIEADYLKKADKDEVLAAVNTEKERAMGVEDGLEDRIETMEAFWAAAQADGTESNVIDTLKEIQDYITSDETGAADMLAAIEANEKAIDDVDAAYKIADQTLQGNIDKKADASVVEAIDGRVGALETASATHATKDELKVVSDALAEYKDAHKDDYTNAQVDDKIQEVANAVATLNDTYATDDELVQAIEGVKTDSSNKDAVVLAEAQKGINAVQLALDTHTGNGDIHVTAEQKNTWSTALHAADITTGTGNGAIAVNGADIPVKGLGSAAYKDDTAFDASGSASQALADAKAHTDSEIAKFVECSEQEILDLFKD